MGATDSSSEFVKNVPFSSARFSKVYRSHAERENRFQIFKDNLAKIQGHNLEGSTWNMGINKFSDMTGKFEKK